MRSAAHDYIRVDDVEHALAVLSAEGDGAKLLAGGQSLVPMMHLRLARPRLLVDIGRISGLRGVRIDGSRVAIGALTTHADLEAGPVGEPARSLLPVLGEAAAHIGHLPIRTRGTIGGSVAHADASAEWCLVARLLDATIVARSSRGERRIPAAAFFHGFLATALDPDEMVTGIEIDPPPGVSRFIEFTRSYGDFAIASAAVVLAAEGGVCTHARVALGGVASVPVRLEQLETLLTGALLDEALIEDAAWQVSTLIEPASTIYASAEYRRHLVGVLVKRALLAARDDLKKEARNG
ncbi:FAD binding domain-containing protein [Micromonospora sp. NPDC048830]|uniref:FAD binding domain-containing protein n=1 Tax=Micromonospora sp. NPDC048830 TaxID=3364257 RepID=UPI003711A815